MPRRQINLPSPFREEFERVWEEIERGAIVSSPTVRAGRASSGGTMLEALLPPVTDDSLIIATVDEEGADALRCTILGTENEIIVAKPYHLQKLVWDTATSSTHSEHQNDVTVAGITWETYSGGIYGIPEWVLTLSHTNNKNGHPDSDQKLVIHPPYPPQSVLDTIVVGRAPGVIKVNPSTLAYDAAGVAVNYLDLNQAARQWTKRTQAEYAEPVNAGLVRDS